MLRSDAKQQNNQTITNIDLITKDVVPLIEMELEPYDIISLVFLLYEIPETALQRIVIYQRISKDISASDSNLLLDWSLYAQTQTTWKIDLLDALTTCKLYRIIRKLGFNVSTVKRYFEISNESSINPMKKELYKLCENIDNDNLFKLKNTLFTYDIDVTAHESCEQIFLDLLCRRFISLYTKSSKIVNNIQKLAIIVENISDLSQFASKMRNLESILNNELGITQNSATNNPCENTKQIENLDDSIHVNDENVFDALEKLHVDVPIENERSDMSLLKDSYVIINPTNVGVCLVINQEKFYPSKHSVESNIQTKLENRSGSTKDKEELIKTMKNLNFEVIARDNIDHITMIEYIKNVLKYRVKEEHSMFMLCILSHGTKGHIYAADSVKVKVEHIEQMLDADDVIHLRNKPKLIILQACQVKDSEPMRPAGLFADNPNASFKYYIKKSDIIIYWATAPDYEAYRDEKKGSIFIQILCYMINLYSKKDHVNDLFTKVNYNVRKLCLKLKCDQLPKVEHTLAKKLYLQIPELKI